ncbi:MAG: galactokinase, partial [Bacteroidota bacterium]
MTEQLRSIFKNRFGSQPSVYRAPGRINLIGEHTDYNEGFVLPAAVDHAIYFAAAANGLEKARIYSLDFDEMFEFDLSEISSLKTDSWKSYVFGVVAILLTRGCAVNGFDMVFQGAVPQGSGMSSSAALECGVCFALNDLFHLGLDRVEMAKIGQAAEHQYVGVMCGIMDQFASMMGKKDQALLLDCRSLDYEYFPLELRGYELLLLNSHVTHSLASSEYNVRRAQCEEGVSIIQKKFSHVKSLRDVDQSMLNQVVKQMPEVVFARCQYVVGENRRDREHTS